MVPHSQTPDPEYLIVLLGVGELGHVCVDVVRPVPLDVVRCTAAWLERKRQAYTVYAFHTDMIRR